MFESADRGTLSAYRLRGGRLRRWRLPLLSNVGGGEQMESPAVLGFSTHTANMVLWVAPRTFTLNERGNPITETSSIYGASL